MQITYDRLGSMTALLLMLVLTLMTGTSAQAALSSAGPAAITAATKSATSDQTVLWKVERSGLRPSYLFGTIHSEDPRVADLSASVIQAFRVSNAYAMEMIPDQAALSHLSTKMFITNGPNLREMLGEDWFARTAALASKYAVPESVLATLKPWVVFMALTTPRPSEGLFLEVVLYSAALEEGKSIHGIETADEQVDAFDSIPLKDQLEMVKDIVANHQAVAYHNQALAERYARGDLPGIATVQAQYVPTDDSRLAGIYYKHTVDDRNLRMVDRIMPRIEEQNVFIAIDAWHLPGENGVLHLLEQRGYVVSPVH